MNKSETKYWESINKARQVDFDLNKIHKKDKQNVIRSCNPESRFVFAIGGNIVSRGLTFNNLLSFFFSRNVKNLPQLKCLINDIKKRTIMKKALDNIPVPNANKLMLKVLLDEKKQ